MQTAAITVLADAGIDGREAESGLRHVLAELAAPSADSRGVLEAMGLEADDVDPAIHSLADIVRRLADGGLDKGQAHDLFDRRGAAVALALTQRADRLGELQR